MMLMTFQQQHIEDWAALVGDYNPIHFDERVAREVGLDGIVVHGMLPLLHIKQQMSADVATNDDNAWPVFSCKFRQPVSRQQPHRLEVNARSDRRRFSLRRADNGVEAISGSVSSSCAVDGGSTPVESFVVDPVVLKAKKAEFLKRFSAFDRAWLLLDSLAFSEFLTNEVPFSIARNMGAMRDSTNQAELMSRALTVQTSHTVAVSPSFFIETVDGFDDDQVIRCDLMQPVATEGDGTSLAGLCQFNVYADGRFVLQSEVGIFLRFGHHPISH